MALRIVRLGSPRGKHEGLRIGTVRRPPRGVRKEEIAQKDIYDVWFPNLAPSETLLKANFPLQDGPEGDKAWKTFARKFRTEMKTPAAKRDLELLAALSHHTNLAIGCYCENEARCHRSLLRDILLGLGADIR